MRLLHIVFVRSLKNSLFDLLRVEKSEFHRNVHGVLKLLDSLFHRAKVGSEVRTAFFLHEGKCDGELVEKVVHGMQHRMQGQVRVRTQEKLMLHEHADFDAELLLSTRRV